jgi:DNA-binding CsgD family transcriptional regulator
MRLQTVFDAPEWHAAVAGLVAAGDSKSIAKQLVELICITVPNDGASLLAFHKDASPEVLAHSLPPVTRRHFLDRYLAGPYLLDPLYQMALADDKPTMCRFRDTQPDRFRSSEFYRQYVERTHLVDEMDFLREVSPTTTLVIVVGRTENRYSRAERSRLRIVEPIVLAAMQRVWAERQHVPDARHRDIHQRLTDCYEHFGDEVLTQREREITQLLLRGYSTKSVARRLEIAPGTVMVHKRNLFSKLGITSQLELFSRFIEELSRA